MRIKTDIMGRNEYKRYVERMRLYKAKKNPSAGFHNQTEGKG